MNRTPVSSSNIDSIGWEGVDGETGTLEVEFQSGHIYTYKGVPQDEYYALLEASSVGRYFNTYVKGRYEEEKVK